ncbi:MAG TPA: M20/M25/M40 family metallo-hydrolase [Symbiobacteriaceae bacterium]|nr:M20/M25/M40 family metallo-hydrolase [Symbiobacteriaceae bacterium]
MILKAICDRIDADLGDHVAELQRYIRQPSVSAEGPGVREMAELLREKIRSLGATCDLVETGGFPMVYGYLDAGAPRTVLFYELYDVQPAGEPGWLAPPFAGEILDLPGHGPSVVGRGAFNSKGCVAGFINVIEAFRKAGRPLPVNIRFMIEGEEEIGSRNLPAFIQAHRDGLRQADCVFQPYFGENAAGKTILYLGFKGLLYMELACAGGDWGGPCDREIHAMHNAWIANPAWRLVQALASMKGPGERTIVPGFYDAVAAPGPDEMALLAELERNFDAEVPLQEQGARCYKWPGLAGVDLLKQYLYEPSLNMDGIWGGYSGEGTKTVIPREARAKLDVRLVPDMEPAQVVDTLRRHLDEQGFPDISIRVQNAYPASQNSPSSPETQALVRSARAVAQGPVEVWPRSAGAAPHYLFTKVLGLPVAFGGLGHGGRSHSANEYVTVEGLRRHEHGIAAFLLEFGGSR